MCTNIRVTSNPSQSPLIRQRTDPLSGGERGGNLCIVSVSVPHGRIGNNISADIIECTLIFYYVIME